MKFFILFLYSLIFIPFTGMSAFRDDSGYDDSPIMEENERDDEIIPEEEESYPNHAELPDLEEVYSDKDKSLKLTLKKVKNLKDLCERGLPIPTKFSYTYEFEGRQVTQVEEFGPAPDPSDRPSASRLNQAKDILHARGIPVNFFVEKILKTATKKGNVKFLVRWQGYGPAHDTWEPEENLPPQAVEDFLAKICQSRKSQKRKKTQVRFSPLSSTLVVTSKRF